MKRFSEIILLAASVAGLGVRATLGDVLPPGGKPPRYSVALYLEGTERFPGVEFFLWPVVMTAEASRVTPDKPLSWYKFAHPSLYAVRGPVLAGASDSPEVTKAFFAAPRLASCEPCLHLPVRNEPGPGVNEVRLYIKVQAIESSEIKVVPVREEHRDGKGRILRTIRR